MLALSVLAVVLRHPELMSYSERSLQSNGASPTPLTELDLQRNEIRLSLGQIPEKPISIQNSNLAGRAIYYRKLTFEKKFTKGDLKD